VLFTPIPSGRDRMVQVKGEERAGPALWFDLDGSTDDEAHRGMARKTPSQSHLVRGECGQPSGGRR
jgi:hypothetical protein